MHYGPEYMGGWWIVMLIGMLVFWGLLIAGLVLLIRYIAAQTPARATPTGTSLDILNRRLAAGEISTDEYENLRQRIEGTPGNP
ncbi:MAG: SHOCT domain-containing protein [Armatimonadota bacterium]